MYSTNTYCQYHPEKVAVTVCERCRRPICLEDKRIYRKRHTRHYGKYSRHYYTNHDYCVLCNASQLRSDANPIYFLIAPLILGFFILIVGFNFAYPSGPLMILVVVVVMMVLFFSVSYFNAKNKAESAEEDAFNFKSRLYSNNHSVDKSSFNSDNQVNWQTKFSNSTYSKSRSQVSPTELYAISCFQCGANIDLADKFCQNCGDSTKEELMNYYKMAGS